MNIVLLIIDTLRYDYVGANGNKWIESPNMDRLAAEFLRDNAGRDNFFPCQGKARPQAACRPVFRLLST